MTNLVNGHGIRFQALNAKHGRYRRPDPGFAGH